MGINVIAVISFLCGWFARQIFNGHRTTTAKSIEWVLFMILGAIVLLLSR